MNVVENDFQWKLPLLNRSITTHCILHHSGNTYLETVEQINAYHQSEGWAGIGYHYYVRKDGSVYRGRPENVQGAHTLNMNHCSIGICFEGNFMLESMPDVQLQAGRELIQDIISRYPNIIVGRHSDFNATECCGINFPFEQMITVEPIHTPEAIPVWKRAIYEKVFAAGKITDTSWLQKLDEPAPVWLVLALAMR